VLLPLRLKALVRIDTARRERYEQDPVFRTTRPTRPSGDTPEHWHITACCSSMSPAQVTGVAPRRSSAFVPEERALVLSPIGCARAVRPDPGGLTQVAAPADGAPPFAGERTGPDARPARRCLRSDSESGRPTCSGGGTRASRTGSRRSGCRPSALPTGTRARSGSGRRGRATVGPGSAAPRG